MAEGIYVEIPIRTTLDELWEYTQTPDIHGQWDLRFTTIEYLPKASAEEAQRFLYTTAIGFGLKVDGEGESRGTRYGEGGEATSALKFWSNQPISLIRTGSGYWKYIPQQNHIQFLTWYDYQTRFGPAGHIFDRLVFRPLIGWATAWSFDRLRLWLEAGIAPDQSTRRFLIHIIVQVTLAFIWVYQGLVPKLLFSDSGELEILRASGLFGGYESAILAAVGIGEILFGLAFLLPGIKKPLHILNILALLLLGAGALFSQPAILVAPFNPITLNLAMVALSLIGLVDAANVPLASRCLRRPKRL